MLNNLLSEYLSRAHVLRPLHPKFPFEFPVFTFIKNKSSENQPKRRSPRKRHLNTEFVKPKQKKLKPEIIDADSPPDNNFKSNQQGSSIVCESCERLSFENMLLKEKV